MGHLVAGDQEIANVPDGHDRTATSADAAGKRLVALAEGLVASGAGGPEILGRLMVELSCSFPETEDLASPRISPSALFHAVAGGRSAPSGWAGSGIEVLALPGERFAGTFRAGDLLVRGHPAEPGPGHVAVLADGQMYREDELAVHGLRGEARGPGLYGRVVEGGPFTHALAHGAARLWLDSSGRVPPHQLILRPAMPVDDLAAVAEEDREAAPEGPGDFAPQDVIDTRIDVCAQFALLRMRKGGPDARADAAGMVTAVKNGSLAGIINHTTLAAVNLARRLGVTRFELLRPGEDAALVREPSGTPSIVFRGVESRPGEKTPCLPQGRLDPALRQAWRTFVPQVLPMPPAIPPPGITPVVFTTGQTVVPVIIVPGIMGTRLVEPGANTLVWNPTGFPLPSAPCKGSFGPFAANRNRLMDPRPLAAAERHDVPVSSCPDRFLKADVIPHFGNLVAEFYDELAFALNDPGFSSAMRTRTGKAVQVLACGYDWRQDNADSARRLRSVVDEAKRLPGVGRDGKVIIVAHSMGGLVSRFFCRMLGGETDLDALILLGSPTHGAPQAYRTLKTGISLSRDFLLSALFPATSQITLMRMLRGFPSAFQLLPTRHYARRHPDWLVFDTLKTRLTLPPLGDASDADGVYNNPHTGFGDGQNGDPALDARVTRALMLRDRFDAALFDPTTGCYMPDPTFVFFSSGLPTELQYRLEGGGGVPFNVRVLRTARDGDQTVPTFSASAQSCPNISQRRDQRTIKHDALPNNPAVIDAIKAIIERRLSERPSPVTPGFPIGPILVPV